MDVTASHPHTVTTQAGRRNEAGLGELMTFCWSEVSYEKRDGEHTFYCFLAILSSSHMRFTTFTRHADVLTLIHCLMSAFEYFGGIPRSVAAGQPPGALSQTEGRAARWHPLLTDFADSLGITLQSDGPNVRAQRADTVERSSARLSGAGSTSGVYGRPIDLDHLNRQTLVWCDQRNRQRDATTHRSPVELLAEARLAPIPSEWAWMRFRYDESSESRRSRRSCQSVRHTRSHKPRRGRAWTKTRMYDSHGPAVRQGQHGATLATRRRKRRSAPQLGKSHSAFTTRVARTATRPARADASESAPGIGPSPPDQASNPLIASRLQRTQKEPRARSIESNDWEQWGAARDGARIVATRPQKYALLCFTLTTSILLYMRPDTLLTIGIALITALYLATGVYKIWLLIRGERANAVVAVDALEAIDEDLPVYTVLVPLHREGRILPVLVERLTSIDYPPDRLQILLLIEMDDEQTLEAAKRCKLPAHISPMIMPPGQPRTKPRALNVGLSEARGKYLVIYDAEDRPERDQLRKAVAAFQTLPDDVVCVQGRLNFYNGHQSLLTRLFAVDYAVWYDQLLPGLAFTDHLGSGAFVPLGGTSNHFRVDTLRQVGGWDPFNVTEDCDLGARLGRAGLRIAMLDSTTWEEAVPRVKPWIRQRSRWIKGYLQTYLVHMRHPLELLRQLRLRGFVDFQMLVGASCLIVLVNPLMWALTLAYVVGRGTPADRFIETLFPAPLYYPALLSFVMGNFIFFYCSAYVCVRHNHISLTRYALLTPAYWVLMSLGAWMGLMSLIRNPYYWAKTEHGVSLSHGEDSAALASQSQTG